MNNTARIALTALGLAISTLNPSFAAVEWTWAFGAPPTNVRPTDKVYVPITIFNGANSTGPLLGSTWEGAESNFPNGFQYYFNFGRDLPFPWTAFNVELRALNLAPGQSYTTTWATLTPVSGTVAPGVYGFDPQRPETLTFGGVTKNPTNSFSFTVGPKSIFAGVGGGDFFLLNDNEKRTITTYADAEITQRITSLVPECASGTCSGANPEDLRRIANVNSTGGIFALAFSVLQRPSRVTVSTPGNSEVIKADIDRHYTDGDPVYTVGFSVGGGDVQNLLEKLDILGIPVALSGHIDSIETGDDASIPPNTAKAKGYSQKKSARRVWGEDTLIAVDPTKTAITNIPISNPDPIGPTPADKLNYAPHQNMDNDVRVWGDLLAELGPSSVPVQGSLLGLSATGGVTDPETLLQQLTAIQDPFLRRKIREVIARQDPERVFDLVIARFVGTSDARLRVHYQSIIEKLDSATFVEKLAAHARTTNDDAMRISLLYCLGNARTQKSIEALIDLLDYGQAPRDGAISNAIYLNLMYAPSASRNTWLKAWRSRAAISEPQAAMLERLGVGR